SGGRLPPPCPRRAVGMAPTTPPRIRARTRGCRGSVFVVDAGTGRGQDGVDRERQGVRGPPGGPSRTFAMTTVLRGTGARKRRVPGPRKRCGATRALDGAGATLGRGELLLLLGPNGAGKTTLIRSVAGRVRLDQGEIELLGEKLDGAAGNARRALGVVPQEVA